MIVSIMAMTGLPLVMAILLLSAGFRPLVIRVLGLAPLPGLLLLPAAWEVGSSTATLPGGWTFILDQPGALMLAAATLLWVIGGIAASHWLRGRTGQQHFALWWLLTLSGSLGVFVAGDVVSFYAFYALASLPAYGLIAFSGSEADSRAGRINLAAALLGEGLILAAFVLMAASANALSIASLVNALPASPNCGLIITLMVLGFGMKIGLVPLHGWMPLSYAAGPLAATAVLSGATSKAGIIGLIRFLPLDVPMPEAGGLIIAAGLFAAFYGAVVGLTQTNPRSVLAYSSISQLGQMAAVAGAGLAAGAPETRTIVAYYAVYHVLTKGGLFLKLGAEVSKTPAWQRLLCGFTALGFAGLPLTGGALGKLALKDVTGSGFAGVLFALAAVGSTVLMLHFLRLLRSPGEDTADGRIPALHWIAAAASATLLQWLLFTAVTGVSAIYALSPRVLFDLLWPVLAGALLAWFLAQTKTRLPQLPVGDFGAGAIAFLKSGAARAARRIARFEASAHQWPVSSLTLTMALLILIVLQAWLR